MPPCRDQGSARRTKAGISPVSRRLGSQRGGRGSPRAAAIAAVALRIPPWIGRIAVRRKASGRGLPLLYLLCTDVTVTASPIGKQIRCCLRPS